MDVLASIYNHHQCAALHNCVEVGEHLLIGDLRQLPVAELGLKIVLIG